MKEPAGANRQTPILVIVRGIPGSGKSYLATTLRDSLGNDNVVLLDPDAIDLQSQEYKTLSASLMAEGVDEKFHPYRFLRSQAYQGINTGKIIIWNQGFTNLDGLNKTVANLQTYAAEHATSLPLLVVEVEVREETARQRVAARAASGGHDVPDEAFARFVGDYRSFANEGFQTLTIDGEADVATSANTVARAIQRLRSE